MNALTIQANDEPAPCEALTAMQWCDLLGITPQAFRKRVSEFTRGVVSEGDRLVVRQVFSHDVLPEDYRLILEALREKHGARSFAALLAMKRVETRKWEAPKDWLQYKPGTRLRAEQRHAMMQVYFRALNAGMSKGEAVRLAQNEFFRITRKTICTKQVSRVAKQVEERGGELAPIEAYCDEKECPHIAKRLHVPEEFIAALKSKVCEPGVRLFSAAVRFYELEWANHREVPGLGRAQPGEAFPYAIGQLRKFAPSKASREMAGRGKFSAKANGLLPALPVGSKNLRLRERIVFDDKRLDIVALDDATGRPVTLTLYIAMDEATRQILGYILREDGAVRQTDVEALTAFVLRVCGFAGARAGYATILKFERGTVAISPERERLLGMMFPGQIAIERTKMIGGGNTPGDFQQTPSGNFFGKGKLESFMATLDRYTAHIAGQRGNVYRNQPLMLGDLLTTAETIGSKNYKPKRTMIEEAVECAQMARAVYFCETGSLESSAHEASRATGVKAPLLYTSEVNLAVQSVIAYYNAERGHRREGFLDMPMVEDGRLRQVRESSNDKAARLDHDLRMEGRALSRISEADTCVLLHKCRRVTVKPNGAKVRIGGVERLYWHPSSLAIAAAQQSSLAEKEYLALYNPEDPRELYLLHNPPSSVPASADALPHGCEPHFFEALPMHEIAEANDPAALAKRARDVASNHARIGAETTRNLLPFVRDEAERREKNIQLTEPLRAMTRVLGDEGEKRDEPVSAIAADMHAALTRAQQRADAAEARAAAVDPLEGVEY